MVYLPSMKKRLEAMLDELTKNVLAPNVVLYRAAQEADAESWRSNRGREANRRGRESQKRAKVLLKNFIEIERVRRSTREEDTYEGIDLWAECRISGNKNRTKRKDIPVQVKSDDDRVDESLQISLKRGQPRVTINAAVELGDGDVQIQIEEQFLSMFQIKLTRKENDTQRVERKP